MDSSSTFIHHKKPFKFCFVGLIAVKWVWKVLKAKGCSPSFISTMRRIYESPNQVISLLKVRFPYSHALVVDGDAVDHVPELVDGMGDLLVGHRVLVGRQGVALGSSGWATN